MDRQLPNWKGMENICQGIILKLGEGDKWGPLGLSAGTVDISKLCKKKKKLLDKAESYLNLFADDAIIIKELKNSRDWEILQSPKQNATLARQMSNEIQP